MGQVPADLADRTTMRAHRASSTDPNGRNEDSRPIDPGKTITVADVHGQGKFTHLWFTIADEDEDQLRELVLRIYWDDSPTPAVECPIGDFFAQGAGKYCEFHSAPVSIGASKALNCYWPMPFDRHAVITVTNEGAGKVYALYYNLDYATGGPSSPHPLYFHTQYKNYFPAPVGSPITLCDVTGTGKFVGTVVTVLANSDGWWGEGNDIWYVDQRKTPTISGTGSEDYFCGAWDFGHAFSTPFFGMTYYDNASFGGEKRGIQNTAYRWHIQDPVPFGRTLLFQLEHGRNGGDEDRKPFTNSYTTVGFYYVDHPESDIPAIPPYPQRIPKLLIAP